MNSLSEREALEKQAAQYDLLANVLPVGVGISAIILYLFLKESSIILFTLPVIGDIRLYEFVLTIVLIDCLVGTLVLRNMSERIRARITEI